MWAAETHRLPSSLLTRVLWLESGFRTVCENGSTEHHPTVLPTTARTEALRAPAAQRARVEELVESALAHPLFSATRRPPEQAKTGLSADPGMGNLRLTGMVIEADRHLAVFAVPGAKPLVRSEGEAVNEWHLDSISLREVSLSGRAES